eukprot:2018288-Prymnesium_polylepis.1
MSFRQLPIKKKHFDRQRPLQLQQRLPISPGSRAPKPRRTQPPAMQLDVFAPLIASPLEHAPTRRGKHVST